KAKSLIDTNQYLEAYFVLGDNPPNSSTNLYYYLIPICLLVGVGFVLQKSLTKNKKKSATKKTSIAKDWD
ncbi:MAG: hypothetical protein HON47_01605, partial [Candidatus Diapherotrites archaeon]|nr:hypothetical protein [Candidatus Diapherotrites archaeon]